MREDAAARMSVAAQQPEYVLDKGLAKVEFGDHQRFTLKWAVLICLAILLAALLLGVFPLFSG